MKNLFGIVFIFISSFCHASSLSVDADSDVTQGEQKKTVKAGERFEINDTVPALVESSGKVPVIVLPLGSTKSEVKVTAPSVVDWPSALTQKRMDQNLSVLLNSIQEVEAKLKKNEAREALSMMDRLQSQFPELSYLNFLRASALVLNGQKKEALDSLNKALAAHPNNVRGQQMLSALKGGNP